MPGISREPIKPVTAQHFNMHPWVEAVLQALIPISDSENATMMRAYMRDKFAFLGVKSERRRNATKALFATSELPPVPDLPLIVDQLWALPEREFQLVAVDLLIKRKRHLPCAMVRDIERWIISKSWWDTVDMLATHIVGSVYSRQPEKLIADIENWRRADSLWLRRTTLLFQLKYKQETDEALLFDLIRSQRDDSDFFIQKAIGWALREYAKTTPDNVIEFVKQEQIEGLAQREALKHLR